MQLLGKVGRNTDACCLARYNVVPALSRGLARLGPAHDNANLLWSRLTTGALAYTLQAMRKFCMNGPDPLHIKGDEEPLMPWVKSFDLNEATDKAAAVFWSKGYEATSITDLVAAMGLNKGSLYNAFGDKRTLFIRALARYNSEGRRVWMAELEARRDPVSAIAAFFDRIIEQSDADCDAKGCFIVNTALEAPHQTPEVRALIEGALAEVSDFFERLITQGIDNGTIPTDTNAQGVAKTMLALMMGMRVLSRTNASRGDLVAIRAQALSLIEI